MVSIIEDLYAYLFGRHAAAPVEPFFTIYHFTSYRGYGKECLMKKPENRLKTGKKHILQIFRFTGFTKAHIRGNRKKERVKTVFQ
jgi:hypothetical protein